MIRPKILFFDFVETVADVSRVPEESKKRYARFAHETAIESLPYFPIDFGPEWMDSNIPYDTITNLANLGELSKLIVLSNAPMSWIIAVSSLSGFWWDGIFTSQMFKQCKPNPTVYLGACSLLQVEPSETMMVAAHEFDTTAAKGCGLQGWFLEDKEKGGDGTWEELIGYLESLSRVF